MRIFSNHGNILLQKWRHLDDSWRFSIVAFLFIRLFYALWSGLVILIFPLFLRNGTIGGDSFVAIFQLRTSRGYVYSRAVDGKILDFSPAGINSMMDTQTGSMWDIVKGSATQGPLSGKTLSASGFSAEEMFPYLGVSIPTNSWLAIWQRFDANWYLTIAENGYGIFSGSEHMPPLFPSLIRFLGPFLGSAFLAGLFISHLSILAYLKLLYDLCMEWGGALIARRSVAYFVIFPTSFFLFSVYTESIFLLLVLLSFRSMKRQAWGWAGFWVFCATLTRLQGAALIFPMLYLMWIDRPFLRKISHWMGLALSGFGGAFYLFLRAQIVQGNAIPFTETVWQTRMVFPWQGYAYAVKSILSGQTNIIDLLNWLMATLFLVLMISGWRKIPTEYNLYIMFTMFILLSRIQEHQPLSGMTRFSLTLFPVFFTLGVAGKRPWLQRLIVYSSFSLNLYLSFQFFTWGWVA